MKKILQLLLISTLAATIFSCANKNIMRMKEAMML